MRRVEAVCYTPVSHTLLGSKRPFYSPYKPNPAYKGKWYAPMIDNPAYKGEWAPRKIANPAYVADRNPVTSLKPLVIRVS